MLKIKNKIIIFKDNLLRLKNDVIIIIVQTKLNN